MSSVLKEPVKELECRYSSVRFRHSESCVGISPSNELLYKCNFVINVRYPSSVGMEPVNSLLSDVSNVRFCQYKLVHSVRQEGTSTHQP